MAITAQSAQQMLRLLKNKVEAGTLDPETAEHLAVLALQEVKIAEEEAEGAGTTDQPVDEEPVEEEKPAPAAPAIDPSAQLLSLIAHFDTQTASLWSSTKAKIEELLKGVEGAAFPLGDFSSNSKETAKGNKTKIAISKGNNQTVDVDFSFDRSWSINGLNPPTAEAKVAAAAMEPTCHLGLRKELLAAAQDITDITDSELVWQRSHLPSKTLSMLTASAEKENDVRVADVLKQAPKGQDRSEWRKWSLAAQVYVLGNDYSDKKSFADIAKEIKE